MCQYTLTDWVIRNMPFLMTDCGRSKCWNSTIAEIILNVEHWLHTTTFHWLYLTLTLLTLSNCSKDVVSMVPISSTPAQFTWKQRKDKSLPTWQEWISDKQFKIIIFSRTYFSQIVLISLFVKIKRERIVFIRSAMAHIRFYHDF